MKLSGVILTHNNAEVLIPCIQSLYFTDEVLIIDDNSQDQTSELVQGLKKQQTYSISYAGKDMPRIRYLRRALENRFDVQRNFALSSASGEWVLFVDADEIVSPNLRREILQVIENTRLSGFYLKRQDHFLGKPLLHGETSQVKLLRLGKRKAGKWRGHVHERWQISAPTGKLQNPLIHDRNLSLQSLLTKIHWYSGLAAQQFYAKGKKEAWLLWLLLPLGKWFTNYIIYQGYRDGARGFIFALLMSWHSLLVRIHLRLLWLNHGQAYSQLPHET